MQADRAIPGLLVRVALGLVASLTLASPAPATQPEDCPTWFPDFRCKRSGRWEGFQKPIVQPYLFEDPFITTGVTPYYLWQEFPDDSVFQGGHVDAVAVAEGYDLILYGNAAYAGKKADITDKVIKAIK